VLPNFYYHPRMMSYDFGPQHPLRPERLDRTMRLFEAVDKYSPVDPGPGTVEDVLRVHDAEYVEAVRTLSGMSAHERAEEDARMWAYPFGFGPGDNPAFSGMFGASLAYVAGSAEAARAVNRGECLAYGIGGGLHHARKAQASGFCIFNDPAIACHILREKHEKVAYLDIDVHCGEGVHWAFWDDPAVLTCSIHEDPRTLYPGVGFVHETDAYHTALSVPVLAGTTGDVWLWAFENTILPALEAYQPEAIVLQMGTDTHELDPLAHIRSSAQDWLAAVRHIRDLGLPIVALGGGGYNLTTVPRMWVAACLTLAGVEVPDRIPEPLATEWDTPYFLDAHPAGPAGSGKAEAERVVAYVRDNHLARLAA
jgi:acetoin utilization protein AcuC